MCWVKQRLNNKFRRVPDKLLASSKETLLVLRKGTAPGKFPKVELRHQRYPDVVFDFTRPRDTVFELVETLVPAAAFNAVTHRGAMLELWAEPGTHRRGWTHIVQQPPMFGL